MTPFYLGIDVSKGYADFVILNKRKKPVIENFQLDDTFEGHACLFTKLNSFMSNNDDAVLYACVESTGGYENNWYNALIKFNTSLNIHTARLNPLGVNANSKAALKRNTTDKISAQNIAEYMIAHSEKITYQKEDYYGSLRKQWTFTKMLKKQKTQLLNQLDTVLYTANTELLVYCKNSMPEWVLKLLLQYPTADKLSRARKAKLAKISYISNVRAKELIVTAKKSIASETDDITAELVIDTVKQIMNLKEVIKKQTDKMTKECSIPEVELLKTIPGIGEYSAIGLMLEIQTVSRFATVKQLSSFFGVHPSMKMSGDGSKKVRMSKQGRKEPRQILYMVILTALQSNPLIKSIYEERLEKGMEKMPAIGCCMHKILRIIYGMLKTNTAFNPEIDRKNREKGINKTKSVAKDTSRRYQAFDSKAPISGRQNKKRMERKQSHCDSLTISGIRASVPIPD